MALFGRTVFVRAGVPGETGAQWTDVRIQFSVKKGVSGKKKNQSEIKLYNLNPNSISIFKNPEVIVQLYAGYAVPKLIFQGNVVRGGATLEREGPTKICKLVVQDGGRRLQTTRLNLSFTEDTPLTDILARVSEEMGIPLGRVEGGDTVRFSNGITLSGSPQRVLDRLAEMSNADWSIQDGTLQVIPTKGHNGEPVLNLTATNRNLLKVNRGDKGRIEVTALLDGSMRPGRRFVVSDSPTYNGILRCRDVQFKGDSGWDNEFVMRISAVPWTPPIELPKAGVPPDALGFVSNVDSLYLYLVRKGQVYDFYTDAQAAANGFANIQQKAWIIRFSNDFYGVVGEKDGTGQVKMFNAQGSPDIRVWPIPAKKG